MATISVVCRFSIHSILLFVVAVRSFRGMILLCWAIVAVVTSTLQTVRRLLVILTYQHMELTELKVIRKLVGPVNIDNIWRIRNNMKINKLIEGADIVIFIKAQRIKWLGHIQRMD
jgi:hypothetical protein